MSATENQPVTPQTGAPPQEAAPHLDLLTDAERAALALELTAEDGEGQPIEDGEEDEDGAQGETAAAEPAPKPAPVPAAAETAAATDAPDGKEAAEIAAPAALSEPAPGDPAPAQPAPVPRATAAQLPAAAFSYELPADYPERVKALEGKFLDLDQKLEEGAIDQQDYNKQLRTLTREQSVLENLSSRAEIARDMASQAQVQLVRNEGALWGQAVQTLVSEIKGQEGAPDYTADARLAQALGKQVETLMVERGLDPAQPAQGKLDLLRQAHRVLMFMKTGKAPGQADAKPDAQAAAQAIKTAAQARTPDLSRAAKSIAQLPAADNGADGGEFADLDKLKGEKLETALEKLRRASPAAYERYLSEV
ncbi:MAG: hypothetical protein LBI48_00645 [Burkholderiaceae bacterium]|jgi:hypothetical protein|nr:hypothetical protein [Burkholderiaceae bacterium]